MGTLVYSLLWGNAGFIPSTLVPMIPHTLPCNHAAGFFGGGEGSRVFGGTPRKRIPHRIFHGLRILRFRPFRVRA